MLPDLMRSISPFGSGADVIGLVEDFIRRFCVLPEAASFPLAVWIVATHLAGVFDTFPYVALTSPTKRCGKTRFLEVLELLCADAWRGTSPSCAALFRMMEHLPTLLLDEIEPLRAKQSEVSQAIIAILNAGHRKGATIPRCEPPKNEVRHFAVYGPKAFACIGGLPGTLADRSIIVPMQRKTTRQTVERFLFGRARADAEPIVNEVHIWAGRHDEDVRTAYELHGDLPFLNDRDADLWMPLFAVCAVASPDQVQKLKRSALAMCGSKEANDVEDSLPLRLLADVREVWPNGAEQMSTSVLLTRLAALEEGPWVEYALSARKLSKMLRPFGAVSRNIRAGGSVVKGYLFSELSEAFGRYLSSKANSSATCATSAINSEQDRDFASATDGNCSGMEELLKPRINVER